LTTTRTLLRAAAATAMTAGATLVAAQPAAATPPGPGVVGTIISQTTVGRTDYILREITIPPGQATGWHYHLGTLYGWVKQGTLSHFGTTCASDGVYPRGSFIREVPGAENVHIGINRGTVPVVLDVLYVLPTGAPLSVDAADPGCRQLPR
jgi:quercetin dioxygenase-like cupin family protein